MSGVTITKGEFDRFWDEVLGDDWAIDEWNVGEEEWDKADAATPFTITTLELAWQVLGQRNPQPTEWITARSATSVWVGVRACAPA